MDMEDYKLEDNFEEVEDIDDKKVKKINHYEGTQMVIIIQIIVCTIIIFFVLALKSINLETFEIVSNWYKEKINDSLVVDDSIDGYKETISRIINYQDFEHKFNFSNSSTFTKGEGNIPLCLSTNIIAPLKNGLLSSKFGYRECDGTEKMHYGLDIAANEGDPIYSVLPGIVKTAGEDPSYGKYIILDHGNNISTLYAHCSELNVNQGDKVFIGKPIAHVGCTGNSTGNHLHLELRVAGKCYDPEPLLKGIYNDV